MQQHRDRDGSDGRADKLRDAIEARFDQAADDGFSGVARVVLGGEVVFERGYGFADRESETLNSAQTSFDFGSVLKELTAAAIFKLEDEGVLSLDDTLSDHFGDVRADKAGSCSSTPPALTSTTTPRVTSKPRRASRRGRRSSSRPCCSNRATTRHTQTPPFSPSGPRRVTEEIAERAL